MTIQPGMPAPAFHTSDLFGRPIEVAGYRGRAVLLSFFRNAACALCNLRVHQLIEHYPVFQRSGLEVLAVFESQPAAMLQYVGKQDAPFPIIADPDAELYRQYGVENSEAKVAVTMSMPGTPTVVGAAAAQGFELTREDGSNMLRMPADFLIDENGVVRIAHYADFVWDHLPFATIESQLGTCIAG